VLLQRRLAGNSRIAHTHVIESSIEAALELLYLSTATGDHVDILADNVVIAALLYSDGTLYCIAIQLYG
jgi:hypothetical protein